MGRALGPERPDQFQPLLEAFPEAPRPAVQHAPELVREPEFSEDRDPLFTLGNVAAVGQPREQIQNGRRRGLCLRGLEVCRDRVSCYLIVEFLSKDDQVLTIKTWAVSLVKLADASYPRGAYSEQGRGSRSRLLVVCRTTCIVKA